MLVLSRTERDPVARALSIASANMLLSDALKASGEREAAAGALQTALSSWPKGIEEAPSALARKTALFDRAGLDSMPIRRRLSAMGYRHPEYLRKPS